MIQTRIATIEDAPEILEQLLLMHSEVPFGAVDEGKVRKHITRVLDTGICYLAYSPRSDIVLGSIGFLWSQSLYWSSDWWCSEQWIYVREEYRGSGAARALLQRCKDLSSELGIPVQYANNSPFDTELKNKLFARYATVELGKTFLILPEQDNNKR